MEQNSSAHDGGMKNDDVSSFPAATSPTGDPGVDALMAPLQGISAEPVADHIAAYSRIHDGLLNELNDDV